MDANEILKNLTADMIESLRREAADAGDCDASRICNEALWSTGRKRSRARRQVAEMLAY